VVLLDLLLNLLRIKVKKEGKDVGFTTQKTNKKTSQEGI